MGYNGSDVPRIIIKHDRYSTNAFFLRLKRDSNSDGNTMETRQEKVNNSGNESSSTSRDGIETHRSKLMS